MTNLDTILSKHIAAVMAFADPKNGRLDDDLYEALVAYYIETRQMPYDIAKARTGDPYAWVTDTLIAELEERGIIS
jgi:hypothetical protein